MNESSAHNEAQNTIKSPADFTFDINKEMDNIKFQKLMLQTQMLSQQYTAGQMELKSAKLRMLMDLKESIQGEELKTAVENQISQLLGDLISIKV